MSIKSLDEKLNDFSLAEADTHPQGPTRKPITIWVPEDYKSRFDEIQHKSSKKFGKTLREIVLMAIDKTGSKNS